MALLKIKTYPDTVLKKKATPLIDFGMEMQNFFNDMIETMYQADGVGLAAPQVGVSKRVAVVCPTAKPGQEMIIANPEIYEAKGLEMGTEGCLSLPGISGEVPRAKKIRFRFQDRYGNKCDMDAKDFFARVIQHELDHLDGVLLIDRVDFNQRQQLLAQYQRL